MTDLNFKGKEFVFNHHLAVPYRPLKMDEGKGIGAPRLDGNLVIHGDNLEALKTLLPLHAGKVDCIFIDPPYNTGNEGWCYNDKVNSPMIKEWFSANPINVDDGLRHDKWCAMMWPWLRLLHELLSEEGSIWITLDDNEIHHARLMLDAIFGDQNFVAKLIWRKKAGGGQDVEYISIEHDYILVYRKSEAFAIANRQTAVLEDDYPHEHNGRKCQFIPLEKWGSNQLRENRPNLFYAIIDPDGKEFFPMATTGKDGNWRSKPENFDEEHIFWRKLGDRKNIHPNRVGRWQPCEVKYLDEQGETKEAPERSIFYNVGSTTEATVELTRIFGEKQFDTPKPEILIRRIIELAAKGDSLVLDSFAGSGTTAHAVLEANQRDGGNRRFILVECEDYADKVTAERIRRVINGYPFQGEQKTELLREKITWTGLKNASRLIAAVEDIKTKHGSKYDEIKKTVRNGELVVTGVKHIKEKTEGLGGEFTYCTLDAPLGVDRILTGATLPSYESVGAVLFHMVTGQTLNPKSVREKKFYLGKKDDRHVWLRYKPDEKWLKSSDAALTLSWAREIAETDTKATHIVFAPGRYVGRDVLNAENIPVEFVPFPHALNRIERE